jgi:hypothetical protein
MTYDETEDLFKAMDAIERYTRLSNIEMDREDIDWESIDRYRTEVKVAREVIFKIATSGKEEL